MTVFLGGALDGRYVYAAPNGGGTVERYDTIAGFWRTFDLTTVSAGASGFIGAAFDGRYIYLVPGACLGPSQLGANASVIARFDAKQPPSLPGLCSSATALYCDPGSFF